MAKQATKRKEIVDVDAIAPEPTLHRLSVPVVATLLSKGKSQTQIAKIYSLSKQAVNQFVHRNKELLEDIKNFDDIIINTIKGNVMTIQRSVDNEDIKKAGLVGKFTTTGIGIEKIQLLQGKAPLEASTLVFNVVNYDNRQINVLPGDTTTCSSQGDNDIIKTVVEVGE